MVEVLEHGNVLGCLAGYYRRLSATGYVRRGTSAAFMRYLFLADFVDTMYHYFTDEDYAEIDRLLYATFTEGDCLLPYPSSCGRRVVVGDASPLGGNLRITETPSELRVTENENLRGV